MITIINYGMGNIASISNMISKAGGKTRICSKPDELHEATAIVLPGVGSFDNIMSKLSTLNFIEILRQKVIKEKVPYLGICLGMQILFQNCEEGTLPGMGWLKGDVIKFNFMKFNSMSLKTPHMGWNLIKPINYQSLYSNLEKEARYYFLHSYHVKCNDESDVLATCNYGYDFTCSVNKENIWGAQFHPEKSHRFGVQFFKNFLKIINSAKN